METSSFCRNVIKACILILPLFLSVHSDAQYTLVSYDLTYRKRCYDFPTADIGYIGGYTTSGRNSWVIKKTIDGGENWITQNLPLDTPGFSSSLYGLSFINIDTGMAVGSIVGGKNYVFKTTDGGNHWLVATSALPDFFGVIKMVDENVAYIAGADGSIMKTVDGGQTWIASPTHTTITLNAICFLDADTGFIAGQGIILKTTDGGSTWQHNTSVASIIRTIQFVNDSVGFVAGTDFYKTTDGGLSWNKLLPDYTVYYSGIFMFNENEGFLVGSEGTIIKTSDGFATWNFEWANTDDGFSYVKFFDQNLGYIIGSFMMRTQFGGAPRRLEIFVPDNAGTCALGAGLNARIRGGYGPYTIHWTPEAGLHDPDALNPFTTGYNDSVYYTVTISDSTGRTQSDSILVETNRFNIPFSVTNASCKTCNDGSVYRAQPDPPGETTLLQWYDEGNNFLSDTFLANVSPGIYTCEVTSIYCDWSQRVKVGPFKTLHGHIYQSNHAPLVNSIVYFIKLDPADSSLTMAEYTFTDSAGYFVFNTFDSIAYIKVAPLADDYPNEMYTYFDSSLVFQDAAPISLTADTTEINFNTIFGNNQEGYGFIDGLISEGAGKMPGATNPVSYLDLILVKDDGTVAVSAFTNSDGIFSASKLTEGTYAIWVDQPFIDNSIAPTITITPSASILVNQRLKLLSDRLIWDTLETGVQNHFIPDLNVQVYPNPTNSKIQVVFQQAENTPVKIELINALGRTCMISESVLSPGKQFFQYDLKAFAQGLYYLRIRTVSGYSVTKIIKQN